MKRLCPKFPHYNWSSNKGYATREHIEAIKTYGPCVLHRKTFLSRILTEQTEFEFEPALPAGREEFIDNI